MNEQAFKTQFIASYLAGWIVREEVDAIFRGNHKKLMNPPIEDAFFLANEAWKRMFEIDNGKTLAKLVCHDTPLNNVLRAAQLYVEVDGPDRTWEERRGNHEKLGRALQELIKHGV